MPEYNTRYGRRSAQHHAKPHRVAALARRRAQIVGQAGGLRIYGAVGFRILVRQEFRNIGGDVPVGGRLEAKRHDRKARPRIGSDGGPVTTRPSGLRDPYAAIDGVRERHQAQRAPLEAQLIGVAGEPDPAVHLINLPANPSCGNRRLLRRHRLVHESHPVQVRHCGIKVVLQGQHLRPPLHQGVIGISGPSRQRARRQIHSNVQPV